MMRPILRCVGRLLAALVVIAFCLPMEAHGYVRSTVSGTRACLYWGSRDVVWYLHEDGASAIEDGSDIEAVVDGFEVWNEPECSDFTFVFGGLTSRVDVGYVEGAADNINLIVFRDVLCSEIAPSDDPCWRCYEHGGPCCSSVYDCWEHVPGAIGITTTTFHRSTGLLVDADLELNEARYPFTARDGPPCEDGSVKACTVDADCQPSEECLRSRCRTKGCVHTDIANTVAHEAGHVLGLDHTPIQHATMYASATLGETSKRELHEDDIQGICDIYPAGGPTLTCLGDVVMIVPLERVDATPNCAGCETAGGGPWASILILLAMAWLLPARQGSSRLNCSLLAPIFLLGLLFGDSPGDLESWLIRGESLVIAEVAGDLSPCGAGERPAVAAVEVVEVLSGPMVTGRVEILVGARDAVIPAKGGRMLAVLGAVGAEDGSGCARVPSHMLHQALVPIDSSLDRVSSWRAYADSLRRLPPGGPALDRALTGLWTQTLPLSGGELRRHVASSLEASIAGSASVVPDLVLPLGRIMHDGEADAGVRLIALRLLARVIAPHSRGRPLLDGSDEAAVQARALLHEALHDPEPMIREKAVTALAPLVQAGDRAVLGALEARRQSETEASVLGALRAVLPDRPSPTADPVLDPETERHLGKRMLLVLLGLFAFLGMALTPMLKGLLR